MPGSIAEERPIAIPFRGGHLLGSLAAPRAPLGLAVLASDAGCSRHSSCCRRTARAIRGAGFATLMVDLLTPGELSDPASAAALRLDLVELSGRLRAARRFGGALPGLEGLPLALLGSGGAGAAALFEAAFAPRGVAAVISDCRWPDLVGDALRQIRAPVLFVVENADLPALVRIGKAASLVRAGHGLASVPGPRTGHSALERARAVGRAASRWLAEHAAATGAGADANRAHRRGAG